MSQAARRPGGIARHIGGYSGRSPALGYGPHLRLFLVLLHLLQLANGIPIRNKCVSMCWLGAGASRKCLHIVTGDRHVMHQTRGTYRLLGLFNTSFDLL